MRWLNAHVRIYVYTVSVSDSLAEKNYLNRGINYRFNTNQVIQ